ALNMDVSTEVQTSRGPVMVMTLPQFAHGPAMQGSPPGGTPGGDGGSVITITGPRLVCTSVETSMFSAWR
ncbi:hypothetical protein GUI06_11545, partial [Xanthomonas citri pv. citri]|nr:hypothetical protein [Xanthomonas citri pv. citri]